MKKMRAVRITGQGGPEVLKTGEVMIRDPGRGEIRVRVHAAGVNRADLLQRRGRYPPPPGWPPDIPGLEYAGTVESLGDGVGRWSLGDRVMGLVGGGAYAEYVVVHEREAMPVPDGLPLEAAGAVPEVFITAHDALFTQLRLGLGERLLIHAVGSGVGTAALQLAKAAGATVLGTSRTDWKLDRAGELGLDVAINTSREDVVDVVKGATEGEGVGAVLELLGGPYLAGSLACLSPRGRMIIVGLTAGRSSEIDLGTVLGKRLHIVGTSLRSRPLEEKIAATRDCQVAAGDLLATGGVRPIIDRVYSIEEAADAHRHMEQNANFGKIVLRTS